MNDVDVTTKALGRLDVTVPEQGFEAGRRGVISVLIKNPFDSTIELLQVVGPRSPHLQEEAAIPRPERHASKSILRRLGSRLRSHTYGIQLGGIQFEFPQAKRDITINAGENAKVRFDRDLEPYENVAINAAEGAEVEIIPQESAPPGGEEVIQRVEPHCDSVIYVTFTTNNWLLFKPIRLPLNCMLKYRIGGIEKTQVISTAISVKPPIKAVVIGAVFGAVLGGLAKLFQTPAAFAWPDSLIPLGGAAVMSLTATIALSRKSSTQGFITVEDFYGGFALGALIGYGGSRYFEQAIVPNQGMQSTG